MNAERDATFGDGAVSFQSWGDDAIFKDNAINLNSKGHIQG
jgi:hypothetical protein